MINLSSPNDSGATPGAPRFAVGQLVQHRRYHYRGVIVALDRTFSGSEAWYAKNQTQPTKTQPWYHVLVHNSATVTYAAQTSLQSDISGLEINHPLLSMFFTAFDDGRYIRNDTPWEI